MSALLLASSVKTALSIVVAAATKLIPVGQDASCVRIMHRIIVTNPQDGHIEVPEIFGQGILYHLGGSSRLCRSQSSLVFVSFLL